MFEYDRDGDLSFFTMEYLSGLSLSRVLAARQDVPLARPHALAIVRDAAGALAYAQARGIVHGDLNPANIFITDDGELRLLDFGGPRLDRASGMATPRYASAQVLEGEFPDSRDDVYSLACIAYLLLTGRHAYGERTAIEARSRRLRPRRPARLSNASWMALRTALSPARERRSMDVAEWLKAFDVRSAETHLPPLIDLLRLPAQAPRRKLGIALGAAALLALLAAGAWMFLSPEPPAQVAARLSQIVGPSAAAAVHWTETLPARLHDWLAPPMRHQASPAPEPPAASSSSATPEPPTAGPEGPVVTPSPRDDARSAPVAAPSAASPAATSAVPTPNPAAPAVRASRIEFAASTIDVPPAEPAALVLVRRTGSVHGDVSFSWWTESGTARPGEDFSPIAPHVEHFEDGEGSMRLSIPLAAGAARRQPRSFYVVLSDPSAGAVLGERSLAMITLPAADAAGGAP